MTDLVLGTAQFGSAYGISNTVGRISDEQVAQMLEDASSVGIQTFDTSINYGDAQKRLGFCAQQVQINKPKFITKFSLPEGTVSDEIYSKSLRELKTDSLEGLLFHSPDDLYHKQVRNAVEIILNAKDQRLISHAGVSIYNIVELEQALNVFPELDLIQLPANIFDLELLEHPLVTELAENGVQIHVRSMFLQGLILSNVSQDDEYFRPLRADLLRLDQFANEHGVERIHLALGVIKSHQSVHSAIVGATSSQEIFEISDVWENIPHISQYPKFEIKKELLDPRNWPQRR